MKEPDKTVCYCFNHAERDALANGFSTIIQKIAAEKKAGGCKCETKNPKGR
jgi:hypothetical protein